MKKSNQKVILNTMNTLLSALLTFMLVLSSASADITVTYYHNDLLGSPVAATDNTGNVIWREDYQPYGSRLEKAPNASLNKQWYTGKVHDDDTGLTYFGARYYDPIVGRFMGIDAVGFTEDNPTSFNRYAYANNNPYRYVDPDGNEADTPELNEAEKLEKARRGVQGFALVGKAGEKISELGSEAAGLLLGSKGLGKIFGKLTKGVSPSLDDLSRAAGVIDKGGLTVAGRSLAKHGAGARAGNNLFPAAKGNPAAINRQAQDLVDDILTNPNTKVINGHRGRFGNTIEHVAPGGRGIVFNSNGKFLFFREGGL